MEFYIENRDNGRMILDSVQNDPLVWPTVVQEDDTTRKRTYVKLSATEKLPADCDGKATNIVLQGLPPDVYAIVNHHKVAKEIWDRVKLLVQGMKLSLQEKECKLYDEFDKFSFVKGETLPKNAAWFKEKAMLTEAQEARQILDEEKLAFLADLGIPDGQAVQTTIPNTTAFQTEDLDAYDSDSDDVSNAKAILMANLSNYGSDVISEKAQRIKPALYDVSVISSQHAACPVINDEETLILEEVSRSKMLEKQNEPMSKEKKVNTTPINYVELNRLSKDFSIRFVPQQKLSDEQAFWLQTSHHNTDQSASSPVQIEAPKEVPKVSLVNTSIKKLKYHIGQFDNVVKKWITLEAITERE
ncbi:hypothetical protein Tco_0750757 [Tanacetum coccineum]|uniref:Uncharacterized protein n=1 Tax=Tanacetum coccineum TaxID=301880 RepID=A0ABQ4Z384_9ASTR